MAKPQKVQTWSRLDVFGLVNGLSIWDEQYRSLKYVRKPYETNLDIRDRVFRYHQTPVSVGEQGLLNALCNEFDQTSYNLLDVTTFELSYYPTASGAEGTQDIFVYYKVPNSSTWNLVHQVWSSGYLSSKENSDGFIVWQIHRTSNEQQTKNFSYSNVLEILQELPDKTEIKVVYYLTQLDEDNVPYLIQFTDMDNPNDPNDIRFQYRKSTSEPSLTGIMVYSLNSIPANVSSGLYYSNDGRPKTLLYTIKNHLDKRFKHKWGQITDRECIWDVHKLYGSGQIPSFYDSEAPNNFDGYLSLFSGCAGGVEHFSDALFPYEIVEMTGNSEWYLKLFPGRFYIDGIPYYLFENPQTEHISFISGVASLPTGLQRGMHVILAKSGYYSSPYQSWTDTYLSGIVYEDYNYHTGENGNNIWSNIYRRRPYITSEYEHEVILEPGQYNIDFVSGIINGNAISDSILIWDNILQPSGVILPYDLNPLNDQNLSFDKFFMYLSLDNRT